MRYFDKYKRQLQAESPASDFETSFKENMPQMANIIRKYTGSAMTDADLQANQLSMQNAQDIYQYQVQGMKNAGVNPALMYQGGNVGNAPTAQNTQQASSMSDLIQLMSLPATLENIMADTEKKKNEASESFNRAEQIKLANEFFPQKSQADLDEVFSRIGVNMSTINRQDAETDLTRVKELIAKAEADESSAYFKARRDLTEAQSDTERAKAVESMARALMTDYEREFAQKNGYSLSSSSIMAIVSALGSLTGLDNPDTQNGIKGVFKNVVEDFKNPAGFYKKAGEQAKGLWSRAKMAFKNRQQNPWRLD